MDHKITYKTKRPYNNLKQVHNSDINHTCCDKVIFSKQVWNILSVDITESIALVICDFHSF